MKIVLARLGKNASREADALIEKYVTRMKRFGDVQLAQWKTPKISSDPNSQDYLIILDEQGELWSSEQLAKKLRNCLEDRRCKSLIFLVGGPYGLDDSVKAKAQAKWCLSKGTLPSELALLIASEQLYRAFTILKNMPYHHA